MRMVRIFRRQSSAGNTVPSGSRAMSLIIRSMMKRTENSMKSIRNLLRKKMNVIFGGRLGEYKYYDMDAVIAAALDMSERELG